MAPRRQPYLNTRDDNPFQFLGLPTVMRATGETTDGQFCLLEHLAMPPGFASPYHVHRNEDEAFYILEGTVAFLCGETWHVAGPGAWVYGPREIPHGFRVAGRSTAGMLILCAPAGFERFVLELRMPLDAEPAPPDMALLIATAARYGVDILGPLPDTPA
jgi:quercetin dioxygenase-like cupin family protein